VEDLVRHLLGLLDPNRMHRGKVRVSQGQAEAYFFEIAHPWIKHGCDMKAVMDVGRVVEEMPLLGRYSIRMDRAEYVVVDIPRVGAFRVVVSFENPIDAVHYRLLTS
jgi:hypothetical protein